MEAILGPLQRARVLTAFPRDEHGQQGQHGQSPRAAGKGKGFGVSLTSIPVSDASSPVTSLPRHRLVTSPAAGSSGDSGPRSSSGSAEALEIFTIDSLEMLVPFLEARILASPVESDIPDFTPMASFTSLASSTSTKHRHEIAQVGM